MAELTPRVSAAFVWRTTPAGRVLVSGVLERLAPHLFSTRDVSVERVQNCRCCQGATS
jgi:hypothetical protein